MALQDCDWDGYYPGHRDHLREVFIPAISNSTEYDRITGDFSSSVLSIFADGLEEFVDNNGSIRIITGVELFLSDIEAIQRGERNEVLADAIDWESVREGYSEQVLEALAWLVGEGYLELRLGAVQDDEGQVRSSSWGQWHQKMAIFSDGEDSISIVGSPNESFKALRRNRESINLNRSWIENPDEDWDERRKVQSHQAEFEQLWRDDAPDSGVFEFPEAVRRDILEHKPAIEPDWDDVVGSVEEDVDEEDEGEGGLPEPRPYQREAIDLFKAHQNRILLVHATGTGKTWTSLFATREIISDDGVLVILAPTTDLVEQWDSDDNVGRFFPDATMIRCSGESGNWQKDLYQSVAASQSNPVVAISTMHPSTMETLFDILERHVPADERYLIVDEVHNIGSERRRSVLEDVDIDGARIGLSATPERCDEGDAFIEMYFGPARDEITLEEAIEDYKVLSKYKYYVHVVSLSPAERDEYLELSDEIIHLYMRSRESENQPMSETADNNPKLRGKIMERARIAKEATSKDPVTASEVEAAGEKTMVFCNTRQHARRIRERIRDESSRRTGLFFGSFSASEREGFLNSFKDGTIDTLVSIDCLTEGVDVPACDSAILVANSLSEREAVQRRGRVLRKAEGTDEAEIHDFITLPVAESILKSGDADLSNYEINLIEKELRRMERMNEASVNWERNDLRIIRLRRATRRYQ
jgi:superfamily II DNA or RNA helicase/HKD family nuclease